MKVTFIGAGAHRHLPVIRGVMARKRLLDGGEIHLYDLNKRRAAAMGKMLMKTPEYRKINCKIIWNNSLEKALDGADAVQVVLLAGSREMYAASCTVCRNHGYIGSDNVSASGAVLAVKGGPIIMNIAKKMEKLCPKAWLMVFVNPVAVLSGAVNNHTKIKALGICEGYQNHGWDLMRLMGKEEECIDFKLDVAGVNHLSFILKGSLYGKDIFPMLDRVLSRKDWAPPKISPLWPGKRGRAIARGVVELAEVYRRYGLLVFSGETDGFVRIYPECRAEGKRRQGSAKGSLSQIKRQSREGNRARLEHDRWFVSFLDKDLDDAFWKEAGKTRDLFRRRDNEITAHVLAALRKKSSARIVTSFPNRGAVEGINDRYILEYSQRLSAKGIRPAGRYRIPDMVSGIITSLSAHQTLLGDAIATQDPKALATAFYSYPENTPFSAETRRLFRELLKLNEKEIPAALRKTRDYL